MVGGTMTGAEEEFSGRRVVVLAAVLVATGVVFELGLRGSVAGALSLTGAGAVAIINFHWLEVLLGAMLQPGRPRFSRSVVFRMGLKALLLLAFFAAFVMVPQVEPVAVALGFSTLVVALLVEAVRWGMKGGNEG